MSAHRTGPGALPPHARSDLAAVIEAAAGPSVPLESSSAAGSAKPATLLESAVAGVPTSVSGRDSAPRVVLPVAPGGDIEPWAVLDSPEAAGVQMELVVSNPSAEASALDGVREALRDMHQDGIAGAPTRPDEHSARPTPRSATTVHQFDSNRDLPAATESPAAPSTAEGLLRTAVLAGRRATAEDDDGISDADATPQPNAAQRLANHAPAASTAPSAAEHPAPALGLGDDPSPVDQPSEEPEVPAVDVADDFGPLSSGPSPAGRRRSPRSRWLVGGAALLVASLLVGIGFALADDHGAAGQPAGSTATTGSGSVVEAPEVTWRTWRGMQLPVSVHSGPASWAADGDRVSGFARTSLGAAIAAAHLSVRVDPAADQAAWRAVLEDQAVGDSSRLEAALEVATTNSSGDTGGPGVLTGWRMSGDPADGKVVVHLAVDAAGGGKDFAIPLAWHGGDWALNIPGPSKPIFVVGDTDGHYAPFQGDQ